MIQFVTNLVENTFIFLQVYIDLFLLYFKISNIVPAGLDDLLGYLYVAGLEMES